MFEIEGKIALITGASGGLGAHFAQVLAEHGAHVILAARRADKLQEQIKVIKAQGGHARAIELDVTSNDSVNAAFTNIQSSEKRLDILVNNAGVGDDPKKFLNTEEEDWSWRVAREAARLMVRTETFGSIINIASIYGFNTGAMKVAYNVSKAGVMQLTKSMSIELCRHKIRVNSLCPGWLLTDINREYFATESGERYVKGIPMRELGQFEDLNVPLLLLASNKAGRYMTGSSIVVDGGISETPI